MLNFPSHSELRARPLASPRVALVPLDARDGTELWEAVDGSRAWLQPWLPWVPFQLDLDSSRQFADGSAGDWEAGRAIRFGVRARRDARLLGVVGLEGCVHLHRNADLGYWLRRDASGHGLMTEAAALCLEFGFRVVGLHRIRVAAATDNHASQRVIARLGFRFEGIHREAEWCDGRWLDHASYALLEHEWRGSW